jgi:protein arginine phosphatase
VTGSEATVGRLAAATSEASGFRDATSADTAFGRSSDALTDSAVAGTSEGHRPGDINDVDVAAGVASNASAHRLEDEAAKVVFGGPSEEVPVSQRIRSVLFLCTGNAARSVIAGIALSQLRPDLQVQTAGTLTVDGQRISQRTRAALVEVGLPSSTDHRGAQVTQRQIDVADVIIGAAPEHVQWVRRVHPHAAAKTVTLKHLVSVLPADLAELRLADHTLHPREEVVDPGGGEVDAFIACAKEVVALVDHLARLL